MTNAVLGMSSSLMGIWLYAEVISNVEKNTELSNASRQSWVRGIGKASFLVRSFSCLKSTHGRTLPSRFLTKISSAAHGEFDGRVVPWDWSFSRAALSSPANASGVPLGGNFTGFASPVSMTCSTKVVKPRSLSCSEKMSRNLRRRLAIAAFSSELLPWLNLSYSSSKWTGIGKEDKLLTGFSPSWFSTPDNSSLELPENPSAPLPTVVLLQGSISKRLDFHILTQIASSGA